MLSSVQIMLFEAQLCFKHDLTMCSCRRAFTEPRNLAREFVQASVFLLQMQKYKGAEKLSLGVNFSACRQGGTENLFQGIDAQCLVLPDSSFVDKWEFH